jgi:hypothetical protein
LIFLSTTKPRLPFRTKKRYHPPQLLIFMSAIKRL